MNDSTTQSGQSKAGVINGVFGIMSEFKSYEIQHWLDTSTSANVRALFETGAKLEQQREQLRETLASVASFFGSNAMIDRQEFNKVSWETLRDAAKIRLKQAEETLDATK